MEVIVNNDSTSVIAESEIVSDHLWKDDRSSSWDNGKIGELGSSSRLHDLVESACSVESRAVVERVFSQVQRLSAIERLLFYLKLPLAAAAAAAAAASAADTNCQLDPLKIPLNPLGSRSEIQQTIVWIRTHLEEDPEVSMPKHEVYDEYQMYCANGSMKGLSTADFGKVMKQVFPRVRPRRLGTRGHSRYCYAGLRRRGWLPPPSMPDLDSLTDSIQSSRSVADLLSAPSKCSCCSYSSLIQEWAERVTGLRFDSISQLSEYLLKKNYSCGSGLTSLGSSSVNTVATNSLVNINASLTAADRHRETQLQLQRKIQEKEMERDHRKRVQDNEMNRPSRGRKRRQTTSDIDINASSDEVYVPWIEPTMFAPNVTLSTPPQSSRNTSSVGILTQHHMQPAMAAAVAAAAASGTSPVAAGDVGIVSVDRAHHLPSFSTLGSGTAAGSFLHPLHAMAAAAAVVSQPHLSPAHVHHHHAAHQRHLLHNGCMNSPIVHITSSSSSATAAAAVTPLKSAATKCQQHLADSVNSTAAEPDDEMTLCVRQRHLRNHEHQHKEELSQLRQLLEQNLPVGRELHKVEPRLALPTARSLTAGPVLLPPRHVTFQPELLGASSASSRMAATSGASAMAVRHCFYNLQSISSAAAVHPTISTGVGTDSLRNPAVGYWHHHRHQQQHQLQQAHDHTSQDNVLAFTATDKQRHDSGQSCPSTQTTTASTGHLHTGSGTAFSTVSEWSRCATIGSESSTPFLSPQPTPVPFVARSRHCSSHQLSGVPVSALATDNLASSVRGASSQGISSSSSCCFNNGVTSCVNQLHMRTTQPLPPVVNNHQQKTPRFCPINDNPYSPLSLLAISPHAADSVNESGMRTSNFPTPDGTPVARSPVPPSGSPSPQTQAPVPLSSSSTCYGEMRRRHQSAAAAIILQRHSDTPTAAAPTLSSATANVGALMTGGGVCELTDLDRLAADLGSLAPDLSALLTDAEPQRSQSVPPPLLGFPTPPCALNNTVTNSFVVDAASSAHETRTACVTQSRETVPDLGHTLEVLSQCDNSDLSRLMVDAI